MAAEILVLALVALGVWAIVAGHVFGGCLLFALALGIWAH